MKKRILSALISVTMLFSVVSGLTLPASAAQTSGTVVRLDPSDASPFNNGEFQGWGTALCWWANRIGYSEELTQQAAELFFSEDGLGLDIARYNVGGGDDPLHTHISRSDSKVPGIWDDHTPSADGKDVDMTYDITKDERQLAVAKAALEANPDLYFEGFSNSAPYFMTVTRCTSGGTLQQNSKGEPCSNVNNLKDDFYDDFAEYIAQATKLFKEQGIEFQSYSPMNEPDTDYWFETSGKQEGCHFDPGTSQSRAIIETRKALDEAGFTDVLVAGMDETDINKSVTNYGKLTDDAKTALGRIDTHTYNGSNRSGLKATAIAAGKNLWQSEVDGNWDGFGLADRIITDVNEMQPSAWVMWNIIDNHKDSKIFQYPAGSNTFPEANHSNNITGAMWGVGMANHDTKTIELANKYYFYGQFTKYINPGDTIIASSGSTLAAYNKQSGDIKIVALNNSSSDKTYTFDLSAFTNLGNEVTETRTNNQTGSGAEHWAPITGEASIENKMLSTTLKAYTLTTYVVSGNGPTDYAIITGGNDEISIGASANLALKTNLEGSVQWAVSDESKASVTQDGVVTAKDYGDFAVTATIGDVTASRTFTVPIYTITGTPSWGNASTAPSDNDDYRKAADGDLATFFDGVGGGWVQYDFGTPFKATAVKFAPRSGYNSRTVGGTVQGSNDGYDWTDLYKIKSAIPDGQYTDVELTDCKAYRYYRYTNSSDMTNIAEFQIEGAPSDDVPENAPTVRDLKAFTDNFEGSSNIFNADYTKSITSGNQVFKSPLERFNNVFIPAQATAISNLEEAETLAKNERFRMTFNMFSGWETNGKDNTFALKDEKGKEIVSFTINPGSCTFTKVNIGGENVLSGTPNAQCKSNMSGKTGANGWDHDGQPYRNTMGHNKTAEIIIDGTGSVKLSFTGGLENVECEGVLAAPVTIKSLELTGNCNTSNGRVVTYDNFDTDIITYAQELESPMPSLEVTRQGREISYTASHMNILPFDMYVALHDKDGVLVAVKKNTASGTFTVADDEEYKVTQYFWKGMEPWKES